MVKAQGLLTHSLASDCPCSTFRADEATQDMHGTHTAPASVSACHQQVRAALTRAEARGGVAVGVACCECFASRACEGTTCLITGRVLADSVELTDPLADPTHTITSHLEHVVVKGGSRDLPRGSAVEGDVGAGGEARGGEVPEAPDSV
jgi:hypothetical protein